MSAPKERSIALKPHEVRGILSGAQTQLRRVIKPQPPHDPQHDHVDAVGSLHRWWAGRLTLGKQHEARCPYGQPGDRLWVKEAYARDDEDGTLMYRADVGRDINADAWEQGRIEGVPRYRWRPSIHMPRWASRITLEVLGARVERLHDISEADAKAEGCERLDEDEPGYVERHEPDFSICPQCGGTRLYTSFTGGGANFDTDCLKCDTYAKRFRWLWQSINGEESWDANPWLWVVEFRRVEA